MMTFIEKNYTIVTSEIEFNKAVEHINNSPYLAFDTETTGLNVRKDSVIGFSFCGEPGIAFYYPLFYWNGNELQQMWENLNGCYDLLNMLKKKDLLMWNGSFDIRIVKNDLEVDLLESLAAEGMLLKHTVDEEGVFALKKVGILLQKEIGLDVEKEANEEQIELINNIKKNGGNTTKNNMEIYKADLDVIGKYACADTDLTLRICEYYNDKVEKEGLSDFFYDEEVMPLYKEVTIPMEDRGVLLDLKLLKSSKEEIQKDIEELENSVIEQLFNNENAQNWLKDVIMSCCETKASGKFYQKYVDYFGLDYPKSKTTGKYLIPKGQRDQIESDMKNMPEHDEYMIKKSIYLEKESKLINISSKKQMGEIVFNYIGESALSKTDKGSPQFNDDMITHLADLGYEWASTLSDYNKLIKIKGAYIDRFLDNHENGYYYFSYKQHGTISGRYGSDAQQLPRPKEDGELSPVVLKYNNIIRKFFISEPGRIFIDCDYESLEPHVFAHCSSDDGLKDIFRKGHDFYSTIAIDTEGLVEYSADKKADNYLGKLNKPKRQYAKAYALGVPYGMGGYALSKTLNIEQEDAEMLIDKYLNAYPNLKEWMEESRLMAQAHGYVRSEAGRVRHLPGVKKLHRQYGEKLLDFRFVKSLGKRIGHQAARMLHMDYKNGLNNSINYQIQSMSASIVNRAAIAINREFKKRGINAWVCAQIHDQLIFNVPKDISEECKVFIKYLMENTTKLSLKLKAPPELAINWQEGH